MRIGILLGAAAAIIASAVQAQSTLGTSRAVYVERVANLTDGRMMRAIEPAQGLRSGDRVVLMVEWQATPAPDGLTVASAVPRALAFQRSSKDEVEISVDGGKKWGKLGQMRIRDGNALRLASPEEVTHLRWRVGANQRGNAANRLTYSAIVR